MWKGAQAVHSYLVLILLHYFGVAAKSFEAAGWASSAMLLIAMKFLLLTCTVI